MLREQELIGHLRLQLAVQKPDLDSVFQAGYHSAEAGLSEAINPYQRGTKEHEYWQEGWWAGFYEEENLELNEDYEEDLTTIVAVSDAANDAEATKPWDRIVNWAYVAFHSLSVIFLALATYNFYDLAT